MYFQLAFSSPTFVSKLKPGPVIHVRFLLAQRWCTENNPGNGCEYLYLFSVSFWTQGAAPGASSLCNFFKLLNLFSQAPSAQEHCPAHLPQLTLLKASGRGGAAAAREAVGKSAEGGIHSKCLGPPPDGGRSCGLGCES